MNIIKRIDDYFYQKSQKDVFMIYLMTIIVIGFIIFYFIIPSAQQFKETALNRYNRTNSELQSLKTKKIQLNTQIFILNKKIKKLKLQEVSLKKQKDFFDELKGLLDFVEFNKYKWGEFVKNLVYNSKKNGLKVLGFTNKVFLVDKKIINKKMEIDLNVEGAFKNLIYLIFNYENRKDLLKVEEITIDNQHNYKIKFVLYGCEQ